MGESVAERLARLPADERARTLAILTDQEAEAILYDWRGFHARPEQIAPDGDWDIWLALAGRGWGKTRTGAEWVREQVETSTASRIALVAETAADARDVMVAEILRIFPPGQMPVYTKSTRSIEFSNGARAYTYNGTEPDQLRGPQHDAAWVDELAKWRYAREAWDMLQFGMRLGKHPRQVVTTTPRPIELIKAIVSGAEGKVHVTRGSTMDNRSNLAAKFLERVQNKYAGTRLGRQELDAEILGDMPGALWAQSGIDAYRERSRGTDPHEICKALNVNRVVVAVDPAVTNTEDSDAHGIVVCGKTTDGNGFVLEDGSISGTPAEWSRQVSVLYNKWGADCAVAEVNQGGDMVEHTLRVASANINVRQVRASRGKHVRAEPIAALYEQGRIRHVGQYPEMEMQMTQFTNEGYQGSGSPDRVDAMVWAFTDLFPDMVRSVPDTSRFEISSAGSFWSS